MHAPVARSFNPLPRRPLQIDFRILPVRTCQKRHLQIDSHELLAPVDSLANRGSLNLHDWLWYYCYTMYSPSLGSSDTGKVHRIYPCLLRTLGQIGQANSRDICGQPRQPAVRFIIPFLRLTHLAWNCSRNSLDTLTCFAPWTISMPQRPDLRSNHKSFTQELPKWSFNS